MSWRNVVLRVMKVPADPAPPPGAPPRVFRAARNYFRLRVLRWLLAQFLLILAPLGGTLAVFALDRRTDAPEGLILTLQVVEVLTWIAYVTQLVFAWGVLRLDYELRWYMVSDRAIRIREGISRVTEKTMTLANIQNISVKQGPLQRLLGIADVEVRSAGGGSGGAHGKEQPFAEPMHVAYFRGVDNAEEIRELLREGVRRQRDSGLGDVDEVTVDEETAVAALLEEARLLRKAVSG
ncbi:MAG TPA: PH domain-containing protein [Thermoanaerobaculia bacterium]